MLDKVTTTAALRAAAAWMVGAAACEAAAALLANPPQPLPASRKILKAKGLQVRNSEKAGMKSVSSCRTQLNDGTLDLSGYGTKVRRYL
jgi:hypothetical protein